MYFIRDQWNGDEDEDVTEDIENNLFEVWCELYGRLYKHHLNWTMTLQTTPEKIFAHSRHIFKRAVDLRD
jgi:hypothetical protein